MTQLHEGLAIHKERQGVVKKVVDEARGVFKNAAHFQGFVKNIEYFDTDAQKFNRTESKTVDETVPGKIAYVNDHLRRLLDLDFQIETANGEAKADLIVDGVVVRASVPVGFLLTIENKFKEYRAMLDMIPTHAPGINWTPDRDLSSTGDVFKSGSEQVEYLTQKKPVYTTVAPATEQHPAQVKESHEDVRVAKATTVRFTATISPAQKSDMLGRCDAVIQAAKRARQRANGVTISEERIASPLLKFILDGSKPSGAPAGESEL